MRDLYLSLGGLNVILAKDKGRYYKLSFSLFWFLELKTQELPGYKLHEDKESYLLMHLKHLTQYLAYRLTNTASLSQHLEVRQAHVYVSLALSFT